MRVRLGFDHEGRLAVWARAFGQSFHGIAVRLWSSARTLLIMPLCDPYRPERHYMRGPGPKSRAKQAAEEAPPASGERSVHNNK